MPRYKVTTPRYHGGRLYGPGTKRPEIVSDKKLEGAGLELVTEKAKTAAKKVAKKKVTKK